MRTTDEWCNPVSNMLYHVKKALSSDLAREVLRMVAAFWAGIPVEVTEEASVDPRCRRAAIETPF